MCEATGKRRWAVAGYEEWMEAKDPWTGEEGGGREGGGGGGGGGREGVLGEGD